MSLFIRWFRLVAGYCFFVIAVFAAANYNTVVYLLYQGKGQLHIMLGTIDREEYLNRKDLSDTIRTNCLLVDSIISFSVDSLGYEPTGNYRRVYDQQGKPVLWVVTGSESLDLKEYEWTFPVVGTVSYKGFFEKTFAEQELIRLASKGYDVSIRSVSAWSTLGWTNDPLLSNTLRRSKGQFCNLLFHELLHATVYLPGNVNLNENLANFIAHKATVSFLKHDTAELNSYLTRQKRDLAYKNYLLRKYVMLKDGYASYSDSTEKLRFKKRAFAKICDSLSNLPAATAEITKRRQMSILRSGNAWFVDLAQYESLQDSLENTFNKIYRRNIKNMVRDLTRM